MRIPSAHKKDVNTQVQARNVPGLVLEGFLTSGCGRWIRSGFASKNPSEKNSCMILDERFIFRGTLFGGALQERRS